MTTVSPITLFLIPPASATILQNTLQNIKNNAEIPATVSPELVSQIASNHPMNVLQFGDLCAAKEAAGNCVNRSSITAASTYILNIVKHPAFGELSAKILGSQALQTLIPHINCCTKQLQVFHSITEEMASYKSNFTDSILARCAEDANKTCYLPGGWGGPTGQVLAIKATVCEGTKLGLHIINRRQRAQLHNTVKDNPLLSNLSSPGFTIDLETPIGKQLFTEWLTLLFPTVALNDYTELGDVHFYGRLLAYATPMEEPGAEGRPSKHRFFGQSASAAIVSMFADIFHSAGASVAQHRKFVLVIKLFALMQEFSVYEHNDINYHLMNEALDRMLARAAKAGPESCDTALIETLCVDIRKQLHAKQKAHLQTLVIGTKMPCEASDFQVPECTSEGDNPFNTLHDEKQLSFYPFTPPTSPENIANQLQTFHASNYINSQLGHISLRGFLRDAPCTSNKRFWDNIKAEHALELLERLREVVSRTPDGYNRQARELIAELTLLALDMAAVCAEKIASLRFENIYTLKLNILTGHDAAFSDPDAVRTLERVKANFERRAQGRIALFGAKIDMDTGVEAAYLVNHIITVSELENFLEKNFGISQQAVIQKYLANKESESFAGLPGKEFITPLNQILYLNGLFASTALHVNRWGQTGYSSKGVLKSLPEWTATFKAENRSLPHEFFQAHGGITAFGLQDDRQNLLWAIRAKDNDDLASRKVGALYDSYIQCKDDKEFKNDIHKELCMLEAGRELRTLNTLDWIFRPHQFEQLQNPEVRDRLETLLFGPESALHTVRSFSTQLLTALVRFQNLYQEKATPEQVPVLEWCSSVVDRFRYHLEHEKVDELLLKLIETGPFLRNFLVSHSQKLSITSKGCLHRAIALSHISVTVKKIELFIPELVQAAYHGVLLSEIAWPLLLEYSRRFDAQGESICKNQVMLAGLSSTLNEMLQSKNSFTWTAKGHCLLGKSAHRTCSIDLYTGESSNTQGVIVDLLSQLQQNKAFRHLADGKEKFPVAVREYGLSESIDGRYRFSLEKRHGLYAIKHPFAEVWLNISPSGCIKRSGKLEESYIDLREPHKVFCNYTGACLKLLLGHDNVHTWRVDRYLDANDESFFERLLIDAQNPNRAVFQNELSYVLMHLVDGVWQKQETQFSFFSDIKQKEMNDLLERAVPVLYPGKEHMHNHIRPGCGFLYIGGKPTKMVIPSMQVSFSRCFDRDLWIYDEDADYKLMTQKSVEALGGYPHGIVLQHVRDPAKKRVLLIPFEWKEESNKPGTNNLVIDRCKLLADRPLVCDVTANGIECTTAAHLYLALIFRAQREFVLAKKHLEMSCHLGEDGDLEQKIILQIQKLKIFTAEALAFDIHFLIRAQDHRERFTNPLFAQSTQKEEFQNHLDLTVQCYLNSESHYREGVSGIPEALRVPQWILDKLKESNGSFSDIRALSSSRLSSIQNRTRHTSLNYRLKDKERSYWYKELVFATKDREV